jgi:hypothetical protein
MANLVYNEQTKLLANALDRVSTACVAVGVLAPVAGAFLNVPGADSPEIAQFATCALGYFIAGYLLHLLAIRVLRGLVE